MLLFSWQLAWHADKVPRRSRGTRPGAAGRNEVESNGTFKDSLSRHISRFFTEPGSKVVRLM